MNTPVRAPEEGPNFDVFSGVRDMRRLSQEDVDKTMDRLRTRSDKGNPRILGINLQRQMVAANNGYPKWYHHETLEPRQVLKENEELENFLGVNGYVEHYIPQAYPKTLYRHNPDRRFMAQVDPATGQKSTPDHVEQRTVKNAEQEAQLRKVKATHGCGPWVDKLTQIEEYVAQLIA